MSLTNKQWLETQNLKDVGKACEIFEKCGVDVTYLGYLKEKEVEEIFKQLPVIGDRGKLRSAWERQVHERKLNSNNDAKYLSKDSKPFSPSLICGSPDKETYDEYESGRVRSTASIIFSSTSDDSCSQDANSNFGDSYNYDKSVIQHGSQLMASNKFNNNNGDGSGSSVLLYSNVLDEKCCYDEINGEYPFLFNCQINTDKTRIDFKRAMIMGKFSCHSGIGNHHCKINFIYFTKMQDGVNGGVDGGDGDKKDNSNDDNNNDNSVNDSNSRNNKALLLVRIFSFDLTVKKHKGENWKLLTIRGPLLDMDNNQMDRYKCEEYFILNNVSIDQLIAVAKSTMSSFGNYWRILNNCFDFANKIEKNVTKQHDDIDISKAKTNESQCLQLTQYVKEFFMDNFIGKLKIKSNRMEKYNSIPLSYHQVCQQFQLKQKFPQNVVISGYLNKKCGLKWKHLFCVLKTDAKLYMYQGKDLTINKIYLVNNEKNKKFVKLEAYQAICIANKEITCTKSTHESMFHSCDQSCIIQIGDHRFDADTPNQRDKWKKCLDKYGAKNYLKSCRAVRGSIACH